MSSAEELAAEYEKGELEVGTGSGKRSKVKAFRGFLQWFLVLCENTDCLLYEFFYGVPVLLIE